MATTLNSVKPPHSMVWLAGEVMMTGGAITTAMAKVQVAVRLHASLAVQVTVVVPTGKVEPEGGLHTKVTGGQPPVVAGSG